MTFLIQKIFSLLLFLEGISSKILIYTDGDPIYQYPGQLNWCGSSSTSGKWHILDKTSKAFKFASTKDTLIVLETNDKYKKHKLLCTVGSEKREISVVIVSFNDLNLIKDDCKSNLISLAYDKNILDNKLISKEIDENDDGFQITCRASFREGTLSQFAGLRKWFNKHGNYKTFSMLDSECIESKSSKIKLEPYRITNRKVKCFSPQCPYTKFYLEFFDKRGKLLLLSDKSKSSLTIPETFEPGDYSVTCRPQGSTRKYSAEVAILLEPGVLNVTKLSEYVYKCECNSGHPMPKLAWESVYYEDSGFPSIIDDFNALYLVVPTRELKRTYYYKCVARNEAGEIEKQIIIGEQFIDDVRGGKGLWSQVTIPKLRLVMNTLIIGVFPVMVVLVAYRKKILDRFFTKNPDSDSESYAS